MQIVVVMGKFQKFGLSFRDSTQIMKITDVHEIWLFYCNLVYLSVKSSMNGENFLVALVCPSVDRMSCCVLLICIY